MFPEGQEQEDEGELGQPMMGIYFGQQEGQMEMAQRNLTSWSVGE